MDWLLAPIDSTRAHDVGVLMSWHGRTMVAAWVFLIPVGVLLARFFKVLPGQDWPRRLDSKVWWIGHLGLQQVGALLTLVGLLLILLETRGGAGAVSHWLPGYFVVLACLILIAAGWLRGSKGGPTDPAPDGSLSGDHYDMTTRRRVFEYVHKITGYLVLAVAAIAIFTGLWHANAARWMWLVIALWWIFLIALFVILQRRGLSLDTYQAIWGPDDAHPGNRLKPIGWGVKRR